MELERKLSIENSSPSANVGEHSPDEQNNSANKTHARIKAKSNADERLEEEEKKQIIVFPTFGPSGYPYVNERIQYEVHCFLATFEPLHLDEFGKSIINFHTPKFDNESSDGHGTKIHKYTFQDHASILALIANIQKPLPECAHLCPGLKTLNSGQIICDLHVIQNNVEIIIRARKA